MVTLLEQARAAASAWSPFLEEGSRLRTELEASGRGATGVEVDVQVGGGQGEQ